MTNLELGMEINHFQYQITWIDIFFGFVDNGNQSFSISNNMKIQISDW